MFHTTCAFLLRTLTEYNSTASLSEDHIPAVDMTEPAVRVTWGVVLKVAAKRKPPPKKEKKIRN